jgi:predicted ferric reductase
MKRTYYLFWRWFWYSLYVAGIIIILVFWWGASGQHTAATASSLNIAAGNITGLIGTYAILWQLVLLGRLTFLECHFGLEKLTWLHKWNGYLALTLILLHTLCLILGFAAAEHISLIKQTLDFMFSWEDVLKATLATVLLIVIVPMSIGIVRRGFKYETWWPAYLVYKHRFQVDKVVPETGDVVSVYVRGQQLDQLAFQPGQFIIWRFLDKDRWWQAHPFSISVAPNGQYLRLTAKMLGDFTRSLATLQSGRHSARRSCPILTFQ